MVKDSPNVVKPTILSKDFFGFVIAAFDCFLEDTHIVGAEVTGVRADEFGTWVVGELEVFYPTHHDYE